MFYEKISVLGSFWPTTDSRNGRIHLLMVGTDRPGDKGSFGTSNVKIGPVYPVLWKNLSFVVIWPATDSRSGYPFCLWLAQKDQVMRSILVPQTSKSDQQIPRKNPE